MPTFNIEDIPQFIVALSFSIYIATHVVNDLITALLNSAEKEQDKQLSKDNKDK